MLAGGPDSRRGLRDLELVLSEWELQGAWFGGGSIAPDRTSSVPGSVSVLSDTSLSDGSVSAMLAGSSQEEESPFFSRILDVLEDSESTYNIYPLS